MRNIVVDFRKRKGAELIFRLINSISISSWLKMWMEVIKEARKTIVEILVKKGVSKNLSLSNNQIVVELDDFDKMRDKNKESDI